MGKLFLSLISIFWIIIGVLCVFTTDMVRKKFFNKILNFKDMKKISPIPIVIGIFLLLSASYNQYSLLIVLIGLLALLKGIIMIVAPEKMEKMKSWWVKANNKTYKIYGVCIIIMGVIVLKGI